MNNHYFDQFYAKSDGVTTLEMHTRHVIAAGINLINALPLSNEERLIWNEKLVRMAVLHDLGKIHKSFVEKLKGIDNGVNIRHELISVLLCLNYLQLDEDELFAIGTHHKGIVDTQSDAKGLLSINHITNSTKDWYELDKAIFNIEIVKEWLRLFNLNFSEMQQNELSEFPREIKMLFNAKYQQKLISDSEKMKSLSFSRAMLMAADHLGSARKENDIPKYKLLSLSDFQPQKDGQEFPFRPFQEKLQNIDTDVILHAPTGSGKTEAALNWVFANQTQNARVFYLLPYTASINAMVVRLQKHYNEEVVTALHSKTLDFFYDQLSEEFSNQDKDYQKIEQEARNRKSLSKEIFYPIKVATLHQVLKTSLKGKGWEFALFDYKNALFIIDEFHTYDALLTGMLLASIKLFRKLFNAKFFFLSATIPDFMLNLIINEVYDGDKSKLIKPDPNKEQDQIILDRKRHQLYCIPQSTILDKIGLILDYLKGDKSVLIIVNNVKTAQKLYEEIGFDGSVQLLHSGFNKRDRTIIEKQITHENSANRPQLLIATQAVEVSLDIDYDIAFIENAPIDALIQRFGRVNRAGRKRIEPFDRIIDLENDTVPVYVFENSIGKTPFYDSVVLEDTWNELLKLDSYELGEQDLINICNKVYENGYNETQQKDFELGLDNSIIKNYEQDWIAGYWRDWVEDVLTNKNQKIEVLCFNLIEEYQQKIDERKFLEANQLLVQVYRYEATLSKEQLFGDTRIAINLKYDSIIGYFSTDKNIDDQFD